HTQIHVPGAAGRGGEKIVDGTALVEIGDAVGTSRGRGGECGEREHRQTWCFKHAGTPTIENPWIEISLPSATVNSLRSAGNVGGCLNGIDTRAQSLRPARANL